MTSINLADDLNSYLNNNKKSGSGLSSYFSRENFLPSGGEGENGGENVAWGSLFGKQSTDGSQSWFSTPTKTDNSSFTLSRTQRILGFILCLISGASCFGMASLYLPFLLLKARKFSLLYSLGSVFILSSFSFLWGPWAHMKHLFSKSRLPFTGAYFSTLFLTIYFAIVAQSTVFTTVCAVLQALSLLWYVSSYLPGGQRGLNFLTKICWKTASKTVGSTLPV